jgi:hypothetical protein
MDGSVEDSSYWTKRRKIEATVAKDIANLRRRVLESHSEEIPLNGVSLLSSTVHSADANYYAVCDTITAVSNTLGSGEANIRGAGATGSTFIDLASSDKKVDLPPLFDDSCEYVEFDELHFSDSNSENDSVLGDSDIRSLLSAWAVAYSISHKALLALLEILCAYFTELPKDPRTLLKTPRTDVALKVVSNGSYYQFGLADQIESQIVDHSFEVNSNTSVSLQINIDGVPIFKSSGGQFWPILGKIDKPFVSKPFIIGIFYGVNKPSDLDFLTEFVDECRKLLQHGVVYNGFVIKLAFSAFVCDTPAHAFLKGTKGHTAYSACERCCQTGIWNGKMTYPEVNASKRTDIAFDEMQDPEHHNKRSPLSDLGIGMVSQFVLDYMHLVCLGVVRRLIWLWQSGPIVTKCRLGANCITSISDKLISLRAFMPREFARKPRLLNEWQCWKATEFRQFLLCTGPVVLLGKLSSSAYSNFMLLSVAMFVLLSKSSSDSEIDYAHDLLVLFVQHFSGLYGSDMVVYNVHNLVHLADDARQYGCLDNVSAFCFENYLGRLIKLVRRPSKPLEQIVHRLMERKALPVCSHKTDNSSGTSPNANTIEEHHSNVIPSSLGICRQYKRLTMDGVCISVQAGDNCVTIGHDIAIVRNIVIQNGEKLLINQKFQDQRDFYTYPCPSSRFRIYQVCGIRNELLVGNLNDFITKNVMLPYNDSYVIIPLLHV